MKTLNCRRSVVAGKVEAYVTNTKISSGDTFRISGAGKIDGVYIASNIESSVTCCECCPFLLDHFWHDGIITKYCAMRRRAGSREVSICMSDARSYWYVKITSVDSVMEGL